MMFARLSLEIRPERLGTAVDSLSPWGRGWGEGVRKIHLREHRYPLTRRPAAADLSPTVRGGVCGCGCASSTRGQNAAKYTSGEET
jgi:hypothetical protein